MDSQEALEFCKQKYKVGDRVTFAHLQPPCISDLINNPKNINWFTISTTKFIVDGNGIYTWIYAADKNNNPILTTDSLPTTNSFCSRVVAEKFKGKWTFSYIINNENFIDLMTSLN